MIKKSAFLVVKTFMILIKGNIFIYTHNIVSYINIIYNKAIYV